MAQPSLAEQKQMRSIKFPPDFSDKVDLRKVNLEVMKIWMTETITKFLGVEDEVAVAFAYELLTETPGFSPNPKLIQIRLQGFLGEKNSAEFCQQLWENLLSAQASDLGVPMLIMEAKKKELRQKMTKDRLLDPKEDRAGGFDRAYPQPVRDDKTHEKGPRHRDIHGDADGRESLRRAAPVMDNRSQAYEKPWKAKAEQEQRSRKRHRYSDDSDDSDDRSRNSPRRKHDRRSRASPRRDYERHSRSRSSSRRRHSYRDDPDRHYRSRTSHRHRSRTPPHRRSRTPLRYRSRTPPRRRDHSPRSRRHDSPDDYRRVKRLSSNRDTHRNERSLTPETQKDREASLSIKDSTESHVVDTTPHQLNLTTGPAKSQKSKSPTPDGA